MEKKLVSQTFECNTVIDGVKVKASNVTVTNGKVTNIANGYLGEDNEMGVERYFSVYKQGDKLIVDTRAALDMNPCDKIQKFIDDIEASEAV